MAGTFMCRMRQGLAAVSTTCEGRAAGAEGAADASGLGLATGEPPSESHATGEGRRVQQEHDRKERPTKARDKASVETSGGATPISSEPPFL